MLPTPGDQPVCCIAALRMPHSNKGGSREAQKQLSR
jgi:hypothetical protein